MRTAQFTPGPWTPTGHDGKLSIIVECQWGSVAKVLSIGAISQEKANAHLIASAPDLLAALERLTHPMADDEDLDYAREVIARAKGLQ